MKNEFKHLKNTLIEIPMETIAQWNKEAQAYSMEHYMRVESAVVELYMKLKTEQFQIIERNKNSQAELVAAYDEALQIQKERVENLKEMIENLKRQIKC